MQKCSKIKRLVKLLCEIREMDRREKYVISEYSFCLHTTFKVRRSLYTNYSSFRDIFFSSRARMYLHGMTINVRSAFFCAMSSSTAFLHIPRHVQYQHVHTLIQFVFHSQSTGFPSYPFACSWLFPQANTEQKQQMFLLVFFSCISTTYLLRINMVQTEDEN